MDRTPVIAYQFARFVAVGFISNGLLFLLYIFLTSVGIEYKLSMSILYIIGVLQTFIFNKRWSFQHEGKTQKLFVRYIMTHSLGYILDYALLIFFVEWMGFPHQIVQGSMAIVIAILLFLLQKFWVFEKTSLGVYGYDSRRRVS